MTQSSCSLAITRPCPSPEPRLTEMLHGIGRARHGAILREAASLVAHGKLKPMLDPRRFTLDQAGDAHRHLESGAAIGKVVIDVAA